MSINLKRSTYLALFLVFIVASSKSIIIYNEEILVAISFVCFILFSLRYFGENVSNSLNERGSLIKTDLQLVDKTEQEKLIKVLEAQNKTAKLKKWIESLGSFTSNSFSFKKEKSKQAFKKANINPEFFRQSKSELARLGSMKGLLDKQINASIAPVILPVVLSTKFIKKFKNKTPQN